MEERMWKRKKIWRKIWCGHFPEPFERRCATHMWLKTWASNTRIQSRVCVCVCVMELLLFSCIIGIQILNCIAKWRVKNLEHNKLNGGKMSGSSKKIEDTNTHAHILMHAVICMDTINDNYITMCDSREGVYVSKAGTWPNLNETLFDLATLCYGRLSLFARRLKCMMQKVPEQANHSRTAWAKGVSENVAKRAHTHSLQYAKHAVYFLHFFRRSLSHSLGALFFAVTVSRWLRLHAVH